MWHHGWLIKINCSELLHEFVQEICRLQDEFVKFPVTAEEISQKIRGFNKKSKIPNVVAAIDGSHIPIAAPKVNHKDYCNRKHYYSILVQGMVDSSGLFFHSNWVLWKLTRCPNVKTDGCVLYGRRRNYPHRAYKRLGGTVFRPLVVGDTAYPNRSWLIRPFKQTGRLSPEKTRFNKEIAKA